MRTSPSAPTWSFARSIVNLMVILQVPERKRVVVRILNRGPDTHWQAQAEGVWAGSLNLNANGCSNANGKASPKRSRPANTRAENPPLPREAERFCGLRSRVPPRRNKLPVDPARLKPSRIGFWPLPKSGALGHDQRLTGLFVPMVPKPRNEGKTPALSRRPSLGVGLQRQRVRISEF